MPLYIKDEEVASMARELAKARHRTVTDVVREALEQARRQLAEEQAAHQERLRAMQARVRASWKGPLTSDHSFLYDDDGSPIL
jgi:hypothetical protein